MQSSIGENAYGTAQSPTPAPTGARWEITIEDRPWTYDRNRELAIEAGQYLKQKNPMARAGLG
jgi:hypothetical protein